MKIFTRLMGLLLFVAAALPATAQRVYSLTFGDSEYLAVPAAFGSADYCSPATYTDTLANGMDATAPAMDACQAIANTADITGKIALIDRGTCAFGVKVLNTQMGGAIAVVVCNNAATAPFAMVGGPEGEQVTVPVFMMSQAACAQIRTAMAAGTIEATLAPSYPQQDPRDLVIWGNQTGQGDFDGGLNGWTAKNLVACTADTAAGGFPLWYWSAQATAPDGAYSSGAASSPTACNGAMAFDSDYYDNGGVADAFGDGPCAAPQAGELESPSIDLSGNDGSPLILKFFQSYRHFSSGYLVAYSGDEGMSWDTVAINGDAVVNNVTYDEFARVPLRGAENFQTLKVKFIYQANYYYWIIDDVQIIKKEAHNMRVNSNWYAIPPVGITAKSQVRPFTFLADVENIGAQAQTNVTLEAAILRAPEGTLAFLAELPYGTLASDSLAENQPFTDYFTPADTPATYVGFYYVSADSTDFDEDDNELSFTFAVSDSTMAKEIGTSLTGISPTATDIEGWIYGNNYYIVNGDGYEATSVSFSFGGAANFAGATIGVRVFEWVDLDGDRNVQPDERALIGIGEYEIQGTETNTTLFTVPLEPWEDSDKVYLTDTMDYVVVVTLPDPDITVTASNGLNYWPAAFLADLVGDHFISSDLFAETNDIENSTFESDPTFRFVPRVRLNVNEITTSVPELAADNKVQLFPNPTTGDVTLSLDLKDQSEEVRVRITDVAGRNVLERQYQGVQRAQFNYSLGHLPSGSYMVHIMTPKGTRTEKLMVQKTGN